MSKPVFALTVSTWATVAVLGCAHHQTAPAASNADLELFQRVLHLTISPDPSSVAAGERLRVSFRVTNTADQEVKACLGTTRAITFWGLDTKYVRGSERELVVHPYCVEAISLEAGRTHEWVEEFVTPDLPEGRARLYASLQLVSTKNCDEYGCDTTTLRGVFEPVNIRPPSN